jgi:O-antigen ligase
VIKKAAEIAFLVLVFSLAFMQPKLDSFGPAMTLTDPIFLIAAALFVVAVIARQAGLGFDRIYLVLVLYGAALGLSAIFSENARGSLFKLAGELYLIALAVLTFNVVCTPAMLKKTVLVWLAASGISALIGTVAVLFFYLGVSNVLTQFTFHYYGSLPPGNYVRIQGTFLYPSMLCNYLTVSLMMLLAARKLEWISRALAITLGVPISITIAFTVTPGIGGVLFAVGWWCYLVFSQRGRPAMAGLAMAGGTLTLIAFLAVSTFTVIPLTTSPFSFSVGGMRIHAAHRFLAWSGAVQTFVAHPIFGRGVGLGVAEVYVRTPSDTVELLTDAHNMFLNIAGQAGIVGVVSLILICIAVVRRSLPFDLTDANMLRTALGIAFISAFLIQGLVGSFEDARHLWVLIGLVLSTGALSSNFSWRAAGNEPSEDGTQNATTTSP